MPKVTKVDVYRVEDNGLTKYIFVGGGGAQDALRFFNEFKDARDADQAKPWWRKLLEVFP